MRKTSATSVAAMAGSIGKMESFGNRNLWQYITGTGILRPKELIARELKRNKAKLLDGILFFKKQTAPQGETLKGKKLSKHQKDFVQKLAAFLNLEEVLSYDLFCSYISQDFRGSQKNLQLSLSNERHSHALMMKIRDFYHSERLYLLQTIRHILTFWPELENHPYKDEYTEFLNDLLTDNALVKKLQEQLHAVLDAPLPSWETHGKLMNERQAHVWAHQNLKEQIELLEILLVYWKDFEASAPNFIKLLEKFKRQGFGRRQVYKHILDDAADRFIKQIGSLEVLVILQALDLDTVERLSREKSFSEHSLLKDKQTFQSIDKSMQLLGSEASHGPILLIWAVVRQLYLDGDGAQLTRKFGNQALQLAVFEYLLELLSREPFCRKTVTASMSHCVVYTVLVAALTAFDETTLARNNSEMQIVYEITSKLLEREFIAGNVWSKGLDQGVGGMFQTALLNFPLDFSTLVKLSTALASANADSASKVLDLWSELPRYTEYLDRNSSQDLKPTRDPNLWQLEKDKTPYLAGDFRITSGVFGQLIQASKMHGSDPDIPIIQWEVTYDGWQLLKSEVQELLHQIGKGAGMVSPVQIMRVTDVAQFLRAICRSQPGAADGLTDIVSLLYTVIPRFATYPSPPLDLLAACVDCITCVAKLHPMQAWHDMKQTGLLPFLTENIDNMAELISGRGLSPGLYGALLAGHEVPHGSYPITMAVLDFVAELVMPLYRQGQENQIQPCMMYILREIFPAFQKWRYYHTTTRKEILGRKCLGIAHKILNLRVPKEKLMAKRPHIQQLCAHSLLFTEAGRSLLEIIATGVEPVEALISQQFSQSEGSGEDLVQLIQVAFSVMNRLLMLRSSDQLSPVEVILSSQPAGYQNQHIVGVIAEYIYHRTNPLLPKLATLFLRRLAAVLPMSILACLGSQAEPIRDIYLMRLQSATEDLGLKTGILELLSVCVVSQPGLIELFLNVLPASGDKDSDKDVEVGGTSCLQTVLELMDSRRQGSYQCPPDLLAACTSFLQALWAGGRETAMAALRAKPTFWPSLCAPMLKDFPTNIEDQTLSFRVKTVSYILKILAQEIYSIPSGSLDANLKKMLKEIGDQGRLQYLSSYISDAVKSSENALHNLSVDSTDTGDHPTHRLLQAWKDFLVVVAKIQVPQLKMDETMKETILLDIVDTIHEQFSETLTELNQNLARISSALFFTLVKTWTSTMKGWPLVLSKTHETLTLTMTSGDMVIPSIQIGILGAITAILQHVRLETTKCVDMQKLHPLLVSTCQMLLQCSREQPSVQDLRSMREQQESGADKSFNGIDHRLKLQIVSCCLVEELIHHIKDTHTWLPILQENMILQALLSSASIYLKAQEGVHFMQPVFSLFITIAQHDKGAEALATAGLTQHVCLPITQCYQNGDAAFQAPTPNKKPRLTSPAVTWHYVYCLCIELYTTLLERLKYSVLEDAFNFVGCHQDRIQQCLDMARFNLTEETFREVEKSCMFVSQLANYSREWRLHLPEPLNKILMSLLYMCQMFISYLIRPRYLQFILEQEGGENKSRRKELTPVPSLQHQTSTEDLESLSPQQQQVQHRLLKVLGQCLVAMRQFSPDLVQILMDQNMDVQEFQPFLAIGFSPPPVHQETPPTFGTMLSCVTVCLRLLSKMDAGRSPQKGESSTTVLNVIASTPKWLVLFVMEHSLYLTMSQAMLYLKDPSVPQRDKQLLKRELSTEVNSLIAGIQRYIRRGGPQSPAGGTTQPSPRTTQQSPGGPSLSRSMSQTFLPNQDHAVFKLVQEFSKQVLR